MRRFPTLPRCARAVLAAGAVLGLGLACTGDPPARARPSVVLVSIDTLRADHVGFHGYERDTTPFLDALARESLVFERAFTPTSFTLSAHMTMLTGLLPEEHGVEEEGLALAPDVPLLAERLRAAGYQTVALYFEGWIHASRGFARGFDVFRAHRDAQEAGAHLAEVLEQLDPARPCFLFLHLFDVHSAPFVASNRTIYCSPEPYSSAFLTADAAPLPELPAEELWEHGRQLDGAQLETLVALYDGGIRHADAALARDFAALERAGWLEDALVIVTSDHGEALGQRARKLSGHGGHFQEGLHVPLLVRHPAGLRAGEREPAPVHLVDLVPTVLACVGLAPDPRAAGRSLFGELPAQRLLGGSRGDQHYLVRWPRKFIARGAAGISEYDLVLDPREKSARPADEQEFARLWAELRGARGPFPAPVPSERIDAEGYELLRALGYAGELEPESDEGR